MAAYLSKSDASEGFNQIIDFLNGISIKYALTVNPNIYVSCIKQFWTTVAVKHVNDITRLQALVDRKKGMSAKRTSWNEFSSSMASAVICLSTGDADEHVEEVTAGDDAHRDDSAAHGEVPIVTEEPSIPSPTPPTLPPQPPQDLPSTSQVQQTPPQPPQRVDTSNDTVMDDESNQGRMIVEMDKDDAVVLMDDKEEDKKVEEAKVDECDQVQRRQAESQAEIYKINMDHANKVLSMQEDETKPTEVQEVVDVITIAKLITEVVTAASETVTAAIVIIPTAEP
uniref:Xylulose kinase-1 n=1 Tax=Tanacetum cinerariifolium TaxID=118510 RepID=A0A6L2LFQ5_TANCI|nr:hypothetical protein [Tanacetum cinerariifolium]